MSRPLLVRKVVVCLAIASAASVFGQAINPQSAEYGIIGALDGDQSFPAAALGANGGYLVWQDNSVSLLGLRIKAVQLGGTFTMSGAPLVVSSAAASKTAGDQENPHVALLNGGGAVIVWQGGKPGFQQIYARFIGSVGTFLTSDIRVSKATKNQQVNPAVAVLSNGTVAVVWSSYGQDGSRQGVFAQLFTPTGGRIGAEFQVNQWSVNNQRTPSIAALANGNFVVAWVSELQRAGASVDVYARIFGPDGVGVTDEFPVNDDPTLLCANPSVSAGPQGGFAVAWSQNDNPTLTAGSVDGTVVSGVPTERSDNNWDVFARLFDADGTTTNTAFRLNTYTFGDQYAPKLAARNSGYFAVWTSLGQDGSREGVFGQAFANDGSLQGGELAVNTRTISRQLQPTVASDGSGRFLTIWSSIFIGTGFDLSARKYE